jgi:hypothetical protein
MSVQVYPPASSTPQQYEEFITSSGTFTVPLGVKTMEVLAVSGNSTQSGAGVVKGILDVTNTPTLNIAIGAAGGNTTINTSQVVAFAPTGPVDFQYSNTQRYFTYAGSGLIATSGKKFQPLMPTRTRFFAMGRASGDQLIADFGAYQLGNTYGFYSTPDDMHKAPNSYFQIAGQNYQNASIAGATYARGMGTGQANASSDFGPVIYGRISTTNNATAYCPGFYSYNYGHCRFKSSDSTGGTFEYIASGVASNGTITVGVHSTSANIYWTCPVGSENSGSSWTERTNLPETFASAGIAFGNGVFVIARTSGTSVYSSSNGTTWNTNAFGVTSRSITNVAFINGFFYLCAGAFYYTSANGSTWVERTSPATGMTDVALNTLDGKLYSNGADGISSSTDGITWTSELTGVSITGKSKLAFNSRGVLVARGTLGTWLLGNYNTTPPQASNDDLNGVSNSNGMFGGAGSPARYSSQQSSSNYFISGDGIDGFGAGNATGVIGGNGMSGGVRLRWTA